jgi:hypothetical protein
MALRNGEAKKVDFLTSQTEVEEPSRHKYADSCAVYIYNFFNLVISPREDHDRSTRINIMCHHRLQTQLVLLKTST